LIPRERFGGGYKVVFIWAYVKRQKSPGVRHSMLTAAALRGARLMQDQSPVECPR